MNAPHAPEAGLPALFIQQTDGVCYPMDIAEMPSDCKWLGRMAENYAYFIQRYYVPDGDFTLLMYEGENFEFGIVDYAFVADNALADEEAQNNYKKRSAVKKQLTPFFEDFTYMTHDLRAMYDFQDPGEEDGLSQYYLNDHPDLTDENNENLSFIYMKICDLRTAAFGLARLAAQKGMINDVYPLHIIGEETPPKQTSLPLTFNATNTQIRALEDSLLYDQYGVFPHSIMTAVKMCEHIYNTELDENPISLLIPPAAPMRAELVDLMLRRSLIKEMAEPKTDALSP